jgi:hypothetical protein
VTVSEVGVKAQMRAPFAYSYRTIPDADAANRGKPLRECFRAAGDLFRSTIPAEFFRRRADLDSANRTETNLWLPIPETEKTSTKAGVRPASGEPRAPSSTLHKYDRLSELQAIFYGRETFSLRLREYRARILSRPHVSDSACRPKFLDSAFTPFGLAFKSSMLSIGTITMMN